jgi:hypothetical protein
MEKDVQYVQIPTVRLVLLPILVPNVLHLTILTGIKGAQLVLQDV